MTVTLAAYLIALLCLQLTVPPADCASQTCRDVARNEILSLRIQVAREEKFPRKLLDVGLNLKVQNNEASRPVDYDRLLNSIIHVVILRKPTVSFHLNYSEMNKMLKWCLCVAFVESDVVRKRMDRDSRVTEEVTMALCNLDYNLACIFACPYFDGSLC